MTCILYAPMATVVLEHLGGTGQFRCFAGYPIGNVASFFATFLVDCNSFYHERLPDIREIKVAIKIAACPDFPCLYSAMVNTISCYVIRFLIKIIKIEYYIFKQVLLVALYSEMIMRFSLFDKITC